LTLGQKRVGQKRGTVPFFDNSLPLSQGNSLELAEHIGYNDGYFVEGTSGDAALNVAVALPLTEKLTCIPNITYSVPCGDLADEKDGD